MNLADYLSELLEQQDEVSVPGLGCFVRIYVNGYYDDAEARFHPPYHQVKFTPTPKEDDVFTTYVAEKKNISLASSKYFAEKFVAGLNEQAEKSNFLFADLGLFKNEQGRLVFKPNDRITPDPSFYGLPIVSLHKLGAEQTSFFDEPKAFVEEPASVAGGTGIPEQQEYYEDELAAKKPVSIWIIGLVAVGVLALGLLSIYKFYPAVFHKISASYYNIGHKEKSRKTIIIPVKHDTFAKKQAADTDSIAKIVAPPIDTLPADRFEIIAGATRNTKKANELVAHFKQLGVDAKLLDKSEVPGPLLKISVGTFATQAEAEAKKVQLIKERKINKKLSHTIEIKTK